MPRHFRQVSPVFLQGTIFALGAGVGDAMPAAQLLEGGVNLFFINAETVQNVIGFTASFSGDGDKNMLCADEFILQPFCLRVGGIKQSKYPRRWVHLRCYIVDLRHAFQYIVDLYFHTFNVDFHIPQNLADNAFFLHQ